LGTGSQYVPPEQMLRIEKELNILFNINAFGMTETSLAFIGSIFDSNEKRWNSIGKPIAHIECKIVDPDTNQIVPIGEEGELHLRGYSVFKQYYEDEEKTKEAIDVNGWFKTGDVMYMDADGYFYYKNRLKDMILYQSKFIF
jgi:fatty-acyl-CoA synthase